MFYSSMDQSVLLFSVELDSPDLAALGEALLVLSRPWDFPA
jgi:hypothetical protein